MGATDHMRSRIQSAVRNQIDHVRELRRSLHQIPEPSLEEHKTGALIHTELLELDLEIQSGLAGTGIVADLRTDRPGGYVILRADMDGLPVMETSRVPHHSRNPGYSHCCGHDGHAACLLGAARTLAELRDHVRGHVRFLFQPAEEISRGAMEMIEAGVLFDHLPDAMFTLHTWPKLPAGHVGSLPGTITAGSDSFIVRVHGEGGHGARPHLARNPLQAIARLIEALSALSGPDRVVSPCVAHAGSKMNVIPEVGELSGTVRTLNDKVRGRILGEIEETVERICSDRAMECEVSFDAGCPPVVVDPELYELFRMVGAQLLGEGRVERLQQSSMGSEDFGHYLAHVPGLLFRLGMGLDSPELHNPRFDFNDEALESGITMLTGLALGVTNGNGFLTG